MIGPLRLAQIPIHLGYDPLCLCCCAAILENTGGLSFSVNAHSQVISNVKPKPKPDSENPFIRFEPVIRPLATSVSESDILTEIEVEDHLNVQSQMGRAVVDGLPDKAKANAPTQSLMGLAHLSDFELELEQEEFLLLLIASEVA